MSVEGQPDRQQLLAEALRWGGETLGQLLVIYYKHLRILAEMQLDVRVRSRVSPSDVVQETLFEAHRDIGQFRGGTEAEFLGWLRKILANNLVRALERHVLTEKRDIRREISIELVGNSLERSAARLKDLLVDKGASPSSDVARQERMLAVSTVIAALPDDYRRVIVWRHLESLSFNEISERMDRSPGACRMLWLRAIEQLRQQLTQKGWV